MNPINIFQMMKAGPQQFIQQIMGNNQMMNNPIMKNTMQMADLPQRAKEHTAEDMKSRHITICTQKQNI